MPVGRGIVSPGLRLRAPHKSRALHRLAGSLSPLAVAAVCGAVLLSTACTKLESRDQMSKGVQAYKQQKYADAVKHFQQAVNLDGGSENARLYLATAYMVQWVPGANTPDNNRNFEMAQQTFKKVLQSDPDNSLALGSLAFMAYNKASTGSPDEKRPALEEARRWNMRLIQANPQDPEPYYYLGVIDFDEVYPPLQTARGRENLAVTDPGPLKNPTLKKNLRDLYLGEIDDGIDKLKKCMSLDPENQNTITYINLLLRQKALLEPTEADANADVAAADQWFQKAIHVNQTSRQQMEPAHAKEKS